MLFSGVWSLFAAKDYLDMHNIINGGIQIEQFKIYNGLVIGGLNFESCLLLH